ncbi:hypothetical protein ACRRTK_002901 [Alexandromys fortis]
MQVAAGREVRPALGARRRRVSGCLLKAESARVGACASVLRGPDPPGNTSALPFLTLKNSSCHLKQRLNFSVPAVGGTSFSLGSQ